MTKKLQTDSKYAVADADGDGVITDDEMSKHAFFCALRK